MRAGGPVKHLRCEIFVSCADRPEGQMCSDMMELLEFCLGSCFWQALHSALLSLDSICTSRVLGCGDLLSQLAPVNVGSPRFPSALLELHKLLPLGTETQLGGER